MINKGKLSVYTLESALGDCTRAVSLRRQYIAQCIEQEGRRSSTAPVLGKLPYSQFDADEFYKSVDGTNCEAVVG
jgi:hypothetical protein